MDEQKPWHRLFAMSWIDFFRSSPVEVEFEKDLSLKKQLLDVLIFRKLAGLLPMVMPDGFEDLSTYNLTTFKSYKEALTVWSLAELSRKFKSHGAH